MTKTLKDGQMQSLNDEIKKIIDTTEIFPFATASNDGIANVVPIKFLKVIDNTTLWITDNYFNKTLNNLQTNPRAAFYIWSQKLNRHYRLNRLWLCMSLRFLIACPSKE